MGPAAPAPAGGHKRYDGAYSFVEIEFQLLLRIIPYKAKVRQQLLTPVLLSSCVAFRAEYF